MEGQQHAEALATTVWFNWKIVSFVSVFSEFNDQDNNEISDPLPWKPFLLFLILLIVPLQFFVPGFLFTRDYGVLCSTSRHCTWIECRCRYCYCAGFYTITMDRMASITGNQLCVQGVRCVECLSKHESHK